jgi:acetylornithine deacetylase/succinyl-diaminopimelate desuccinylase family protein
MIDHVSNVQAWLDARSDEMAALVWKLVAVDTENPPGRGLRQCASVLHEVMNDLGLDPEIVRIPPSSDLEDPCIVRGTVGHGSKLVHFHGHFDVVPAQDRSQFRTELRDGKIFGRRAADMKGGIVSMLYGAAAARELSLLGDGRIGINLVCDEETGRVVGSGYLREAGLIDRKALAMVTAEPSGGSIWNAARGAITLRVTVQGQEAHVGQANRGVNAYHHMVRVAAPLMTYAQEMLNRHTHFPMDEHDGRGSMIVVGGMSGSGSNFNVVPGSAWFSVDSRYNPEEDLGTQLTTLRNIIAEAAAEVGARAHVEVTQFQPSARTEATHPASAALARCIEEVHGIPAMFALCPGVLDVRWYAQLGIPAFGYGAGLLEVSHGPDEYIDEPEMRRCAAVYALYASDMLS